jgi:sulfur relay (sulfurtransferase) DsrF/TusC family protein
MMKKVAVLIRDKEQQYEGLRTSLGLLLESVEVKMFVLDHEVVALANKENDEEAYEEYFDNMEFIDEMDGERYSNNRNNVEKHGFKNVTPEEAVAILKDADIVIPF